jgi:6-phosphogluconolactonase
MAEAAAAITGRGKFSVALSGGSTPAPFYSLLSTEQYRSRINWERIHFFWADERCVPQDHPDSNFRLALDLLLSKVPVPDTNIHRIPGELDPEEAANIYDEGLRVFFGDLTIPGFDLIYLGVGTDGHTASIFPDEKAVGNFTRAAVPVYVEKLGSHRVSLTLPVLNNAGMVVFLVTGKSKARIVRDILGGKNPDLPAARVNPTKGKSVWLLDLEAAKLLADSVMT